VLIELVSGGCAALRPTSQDRAGGQVMMSSRPALGTHCEAGRCVLSHHPCSCQTGRAVPCRGSSRHVSSSKCRWSLRRLTSPRLASLQSPSELSHVNVTLQSSSLSACLAGSTLQLAVYCSSAVGLWPANFHWPAPDG